jgi:signal transduction histidine kinase
VPGSNPQASNASQAAALTTRWLRPLGLATIAVVLALSFGQHPAPALQGSGLAVTVALVVLVSSFVALVRHSGGGRGGLVALAALIGASSALVYTQHGGLGVAGLFVAVAYAAMNLPLAGSLATLALATATLAIAAVHAERSAGLIVGAELGVVAFYVLAGFARRAQEAHAQTARLLGELEESRRSQEEAAALRERSRIAREIHDVLAHSLSGLMLQLEGARMLASMPSGNGQLEATLERAHHLAAAGLEEARRAIGALRDEELPGAERLQQLAAEFTRDSGVHTTLEVVGSPRRLDSEASLTLFRVAQEALTNARRHAHPNRVELRLAYEPDGTRLVVEDHRDPGARPATVPASPEQRPSGDDRPGYGLTGMRERAELLRGELAASPTDDGFRVELWIPA